MACLAAITLFSIQFCFSLVITQMEDAIENQEQQQQQNESNLLTSTSAREPVDSSGVDHGKGLPSAGESILQSMLQSETENDPKKKKKKKKGKVGRQKELVGDKLPVKFN